MVENPFTINLEVLLSVLYGWRSIEATGRIRLKSRGKRLKPKTWEHQRTPDYREHELIRDHPKASILNTETNHHPRASKFQSKTHHANSPATQEHSPEHQYMDCPKSHQTHRPISKHYWALHCTPERRNPAPPTRTPTQASLTRKPQQAKHPAPPTGRNIHNKKEPQTTRIQKGHPAHSKLNKITRQRNNHQVKEHEKCPPSQTKE